ncbi:MAG: DoxX family protein [Bacteroidetes bacterium]|nr:DoxX family protein [Bacteroidota bacterium]
MTVYTIFSIVAAAALALGILRFFVKKPTNIYVTFLQDFIGVFFIFSGFVKAVDPLGTSFKMHEYFEAFAQEGFRPLWEFLTGFSTAFAILMIAAELFFGFMLLLGWKTRWTVGFIWLLTLFFTFLTGYTYLSGYCITPKFILSAAFVFGLLALIVFPKTMGKKITILGPSVLLLVILCGMFMSDSSAACSFTETKMKVTDCGCFGDFIKLKPWETFYKDIILDLMILVLVLTPHLISEALSTTFRNIAAGIIGGLALLFCLYNVYWNEPVLDFRPYAVGNNIPELRTEKKPAKVEMIFVYRSNKTGEAKEFSYDDVMKGKMDYAEYDSMIERKDKVLDPGIPAKITNLRIENDEGTDITDELFAEPGYSFMVVAYNLHKTNEPAFQKLNEIAAGSGQVGAKFFAVTVNDGKVEDFRHRNQTAYPFYHADETPLKTIIRSNPGLVLLKNGTVVGKWHYRHLPSWEDLKKEYFSNK